MRLALEQAERADARARCRWGPSSCGTARAGPRHNQPTRPATPPPTPRSWPCAKPRAPPQLPAERGDPLRHRRAVPDVRRRHRPRAHRQRWCSGATTQGRRRPLAPRPERPPLNHRFGVVEGVLGEECRELLQRFFRGRGAPRPPARSGQAKGCGTIGDSLTTEARRGARVVESGGLENRCALTGTGVRIPPSPPAPAEDVLAPFGRGEEESSRVHRRSR